MRVKRFTYTKSQDNVSKRVVWSLSMPSDKLFGIDLSEFSPSEQADYIAELDKLWEEFSLGIVDLGLKYNYRLFNNNKISDLVG